MIKFLTGDFFEYEANIRINTVNCVGVMGAGVALAFKKRYPEMFEQYSKDCKNKILSPGNPTTWLQKELIGPPVEIINFPTKTHWRKPSEYQYIVDGLLWLSEHLKDKKGQTVTIPALGCGNGGLDWATVKNLIANHLKNTDANILVFEPQTKSTPIKTQPFNDELKKTAELLEIEEFLPTDEGYPEQIKKFSKKRLFHYPKTSDISDFDFTLVSSSKPDAEEQLEIFKIIEQIKTSNSSVLLGTSAFDRKLASMCVEKQIKVGAFLTNDILNSVKKIKNKSENYQIELFSLGELDSTFNKKDYLPSIFGRISLSKKTIFTTKRLEWIDKNISFFKKLEPQTYYIDYETLGTTDRSAVAKIHSSPINTSESQNK